MIAVNVEKKWKLLIRSLKANLLIYLFISDIYVNWPSSASSWFEWGLA